MNKFQSEIFQEVLDHPQAILAEVDGSVPTWISGAFLRAGPGRYTWNDSSYNHWFEGDALLYRFHIADGKVEFSSKFLESNSYRESCLRNRIARPNFATHVLPDPCKNILQRYMSYFFGDEKQTDNCNVAVVKIKDNICATADLPTMWKIDENTLESMFPIDIESALPGLRSWTAHPHYENGDYFNCSTDFHNNLYEFIRIPGANNKYKMPLDGIEVVATVPFKGDASYFHSFGITERFFLFMESSMMLTSYFKSSYWNEVALKLLNKTHSEMMKFQPDKKSRFHLVERKSGRTVGVYEVDSFFCFHQVNAYECGDELIFDSTMYPDGSVIENLYLSEIRSGKMLDAFPAELRRYRLPLDGIDGECPLEINLEKHATGLDYELIHPSFEMPKINYDAINGKKYQFTYGIGNSTIRRGLTTLLKINVETKECLEWQEENCYPSEPVFVPSPTATKEDDGVVLSAVLGLYSKRSFLLFLDGETMKEIARANIPSKLIPLFHGDFFSS